MESGREVFLKCVHDDGSFSDVREEIGFIPWYV